jgi:iron complex outermembrane receptor protein
MSRKSARKAWLSTVGLGVGLWGSGAGSAADPLPLAPQKPGDIQLVKQEKKDPVPVQKKDPTTTTTPTDPVLPELPGIRGGGGQGPAPNPDIGTKTQSEAPPSAAVAGGTSNAVDVAANSASQVLGASDLSQLLFKSSASTGVQFQQRNPLVNDPRIRGLRNTQFLMYGDSAFFAPVRLDLDTPVTRFDPGSVRDIIVVKGPYSALYGPGHAVLDVATLDSPRFKCFEFHGRTSLGYQTNGERWDGLQSVWAGESNWGARVTYNGLTGSDYKDGNGNSIPSSYLSHNVSWAIGWDLSEKTSVEFKGQRVYQEGLEFPGLYFDVQELNTEAYTLRFTSKDQGFFDRFEFDAWYNTSVGVGNTAAGPKQNFVQQLLAVSFNPGRFNQSAFNNFGYLPLPSIQTASMTTGPGGAPLPPLNLFTDESTSRFATSSLGYRTFLEWGKEKDENRLIAGTDLRLLGQGLTESIRLKQTQGTSVVFPLPLGTTLEQNQSIPDSNLVNPGLFAQLDMPLNNRLTLRGGGRADWVRTSTGVRQIDGNIDLFGQPAQPNPGRFVVDPAIYSTDPQGDTTRNFFLLAGFLQSEYKFTDEITGTVSVGHSQRAPTLTELYAAGPFLGVLQQGTSRVIGDPNLASEKLTQIDLGLRAQNEFMQVGAGVFYGWINDFITYDQNSGGPGLTQVVYTNTDLATLAGAELFGQIDVTSWLSTYATMTYVQGIDQTHNVNRRNPSLSSSRATNTANGQYATDTEALPQIPPLESRVGFRIHQPTLTPKWQLDLGARMVASQNNIARSLGELGTPGFTTFNIRGYWQASERLLLTAGVENLGNRFYREHLDPVSGTILGINPLYRPGTNFYFGTQYSY